MLISCPYCGPRDLAEFSYQGDATRIRPGLGSNDLEAWNAFTYQRANPAGRHTEYWQHSGGCRCHLVVVRDTRTHHIESVRLARELAVERQAGPGAGP